jgi:two-component system chemotaxis response regulator CheY
MRALVIDDSRAMRSIIGGILRGLGFEVGEAGNGVEGLVKLAQPEKPDLVMVDWNMPEMNGIDFVRAARKRPEFNTVRIVMVTTETEMARMAEALASGADEYVMKPFTRDVLINKLELLGFAAPA